MADRRYDRDRGEKPRPRPRSRSASESSASRRSTPPQRRRTAAASRDPRAAGARRPAPRKKPSKTARRRGGFWRGLGLFLLVSLIAVAIVGGVVYYSMASELPDPDLTKARGRDQSSVITDREGRVLAKVFAEQNRSDKELSKIPVHLRQAVIATEDRRFYEHAGVDPLGITRALVTDVALRKKAQGGSTITQQYVKQAFVTPEKTLKRKLMEAILAQRVEQQFTKDEILELYLNTIYFGHGAYGVEAASQAYFGKSVEKVSVAEAAMLAGVIKSPGNYSPYLEPENAQRRRDIVLMQMRDQGYIDEAAYAAAVESPVEVSGLKSSAVAAPYFVEWIKAQLIEKYGQEALYRGGLKVRTTLDLEMQKAAEKAVSQTLNREGDPSAAVVAIRPGTGEVLAMVGGRDFASQQYNVATQGRRQPGSAYKPFVLVSALEQGVSPEAAFESGPRKLKVGDQTWSVTGASGGRKGPMRLREATWDSVNSVYAQLILNVGAEKVVETSERLGIETSVTPVPAIALGGLERGVSPLEMANSYATLAAKGRHSDPYGVMWIADSTDKRIYETKPESDEAIDPAVAYLTTDILTGVISKGTGKGAAIGRPAAGKTGTTQEYRDAWFVGYTPDLACAVWVGYPDSQREMKSVHGKKVTGGSFPATIWARFMKSALSDTKATPFTKPAGLVQRPMCLESGMAPTEFCPKKGTGLFLAKNEPETCTIHTSPVKVSVPNLVGMTKEAALALLEKLKLIAKVIDKDVPGIEPGTVASQTPKAGSQGTSQTVVTITVSTGSAANKPPVASFTLSSQIKPGQAAVFDATKSSDDGRITKYYWEFGDGQTAEGVKVTHTYAAVGTYEVTLWVTDDKGAQASSTQTIRIK